MKARHHALVENADDERPLLVKLAEQHMAAFLDPAVARPELVALAGDTWSACHESAARLELAQVPISLVAAWTSWRPTSAAGQWLAGLGVAAAVCGAWMAALA